MIAHVGGVPLEEILPSLTGTGAGFAAGALPSADGMHLATPTGYADQRTGRECIP